MWTDLKVGAAKARLTTAFTLDSWNKLRAEVIDEHNVDAGLVHETDEQGAAIGGDGERGSAVIGLFFVADKRQRTLFSCEIVEEKSALAGRGNRGVVDAIPGHSKVAPGVRWQSTDDLELFSTVNWDLPNPRQITALRVVDVFSIP